MIPFVANENIFDTHLNMKKKLTLWIFLLPLFALAQQTEFKNGAITIDFSKKKGKQTDTVITQQDADEEEQPAKKERKKVNMDGAPEEFNPKRDGLFKAIFAAGVNLSQIDGDEQAGYRQPGAHAGVGVMVKFHKNMSVSTEILYNMKGAYRRLNANETPQYMFRQSWDYVSIPLHFNVHDKKLIIASAGLSFNYLVRNQLRYDVYDLAGNISDSLSTFGRNALAVPPRKFDLCVNVGFQFLIKQVLGIGARFEYSLIGLKPSLGAQTKVARMFNNTITLRVQYILGPVKKKKR